jgi:hypothetical protein
MTKGKAGVKVYIFLEQDKETARIAFHVFLFLRSAQAFLQRKLNNGAKWVLSPVAVKGDAPVWETRAYAITLIEVPLLLADFSFRRWFRQWCYWQNLTDKETGSLWRSGHAWFRRPDEYHKGFRVEWSVLGSYRWLGAKIDLFDGDSHRDVDVSIGLGIAAIYLGFECVLPKRFGYPRHSWAHTTGIEMHWYRHAEELTVSLNWHYAGDDCYSCGRKVGWHFYWCPVDTLLGSRRHSSVELEQGCGVVAMTEGNYPVTVKLTRDEWKRARWPWPLVVYRAHVESEQGIPFPGKGENSWDCGENASFGLTCQANTVDEAVEAMRESVLRDRERYGGKGWLPEAVKKAA